MITQKPAFFVGDKAFATKEEAQAHGLTELFRPVLGANSGEIAKLVMEGSAQVIAILTGKPLPAKRGPYKRKAKVQTPDLPLENTAT